MKVRIYKSPDGNGKYLNKTSQFLEKAQKGKVIGKVLKNVGQLMFDFDKADEIQKATFLEWQPKEIITNIAAKENAQIQGNVNLNLLKNNLIWLSKNVEQPVPLQLDTYRQKQKQMQTTDSQNTSLLFSPTEMEINYMAIEKEKFLHHPDKTKADFYAYWIKSLRKDMHIEEGVRVVEQLAAAQKTGFVIK